jgi:hypothetical protein
MAKSNDCFKISLFNTFDKYFVKNEKFDKSPFNYLIYINRCDNINKMNLINNNLFDEEFESRYVKDDYKIGLINVNFMGENLMYNFYCWDEKDITKLCFCDMNSFNIDSTPYVRYSVIHTIMDSITHFYKYNIINEKFTTTSEHTLTLEEYVRKIADYLLNIPNLKVYVLLPNLNVIEYSPSLPCSTWTDSYLLIKYYNKNISRFEPIFENILKNYYTQNLTKTIESIYKNNYHLGNDLNKVRNDIKTYYQDDDDYWNGKLTINQKTEVKEVKYSLDPILLKYQEQIKEFENKIKKMKELHSQELEKVKDENSTQIKAIKVNYGHKLIREIENAKNEYSSQLSKIEDKYISKISEQEEELIKYSSAKIITDNMFEGVDNSETIRLKTENAELTSQNELLIKQFNGMKKKLENKIAKIQEQEEELTTLKTKLSKQDNIIKKLTAY